MSEKNPLALALLAVAGSITMTVMYDGGKFTFWDFVPGVLLLSITVTYWNNVEFSFWPNVAVSILMGGAGLLMLGFVLEPTVIKWGRPYLLGAYPDLDDAGDAVCAFCWIAISIVTFIYRCNPRKSAAR